MATASEIAAEFDCADDALIYIASELPKIEGLIGICATIAILYGIYKITLFFANWIKMFF